MAVVNTQYCSYHDRYEIKTEESICCPGCAHVWLLGAADLIQSEANLRFIMGIPAHYPVRVETIYTCPYCTQPLLHVKDD